MRRGPGFGMRNYEIAPEIFVDMKLGGNASIRRTYRRIRKAFRAHFKRVLKEVWRHQWPPMPKTGWQENGLLDRSKCVDLGRYGV